MLAPAMAWCPALLTAAPRRRRGCLSAAGAPGSLLAAAPPRPPFPQALAQFLELRSRRLQFAFQPLLSLYRLAMHSAVIARLPALLYYLAPQLGYLAPACRRAATRIPPEPSHTSFLSTPIRLCPAVPHRFTEYLPLAGTGRHWPPTNVDELNAAVLGPTHPLVRGPPARGVGRDRPRRHCRSKPYPGTAPARPSERRVLVHMRPRNPPSEPLTAPTTATAPDSSVTTASVDRSLIGEPISRMRTARP